MHVYIYVLLGFIVVSGVFLGPGRIDVSMTDCETKTEQEEASEGSGVLP